MSITLILPWFESISTMNERDPNAKPKARRKKGRRSIAMENLVCPISSNLKAAEENKIEVLKH